MLFFPIHRDIVSEVDIGFIRNDRSKVIAAKNYKDLNVSLSNAG